MSASDIELLTAKRAITIPRAWRKLDLPGFPYCNPTCSPLRSDETPSFSISEDGRVFYDHGTGERGDVVTFVMMATHLPFQMARRWLIEAAASMIGDEPVSVPAGSPVPASIERALTPVSLPDLSVGTEADLATLARGRNLSRAGLELATRRGLLRFCDYQYMRAWVVTDRLRCNAQARRLDGINWTNGCKVKGFKGNVATWPIGTIESMPFRHVLVVEGSPDLLAAHHFIAAAGAEAIIAAVCMAGAGLSVHRQARECLRNKHVWIVAQNDTCGLAAAEKWCAEIRSGANSVELFRLTDINPVNGHPLKDLNDSAAINSTAVTQFLRSLT